MGTEIMSGLSAFGGGLIGYVVPFLFVLTIVVFFHELGHFLMARWCGIKVLVFSIGFGPEITGFNDRYGTRWKISAVPLGGYVKFFGDDNAASVPDQAAIAAMSEAIYEAQTRTKSPRWRNRDWSTDLAAGGLFKDVERARFEHVLELPREALRDHLMSYSGVAALSEDERKPLFSKVAALLDADESVSGNGTLRLPFVVTAFRATRSG